MAFRLRPARKTDEPLIWRATMETVWADVPDDEKPSLDRRTFEQHFREYAREFVEGRRGERFVTEDNGGNVVGYMILGEMRPFFTPNPVGFIYDIWVEPGRRQKGVGSFLLAEAERWAQARGFRKIKLEVSEANAPALALYRKTGYRAERTYMAKSVEAEREGSVRT